MTRDVTTGRRAGLVPSSRSEVDAFIGSAKSSSDPGLIFALDATMSRQPTWDLACRLQGGLFDAVRDSGRLAVQLVYFRGLGECRASRFVSDTGELARLMTGIQCQGGTTQIGKVLAHTRRTAGERPVGVLVYVGDAVEESVDALLTAAGPLGLLGTRCIMIQEGSDRGCEDAFRGIARLTKGAYARLDAKAPDRLRSLLKAAASVAVGGREALAKQETAEGRMLLQQIAPDGGA